jgi:hypothetical protein
MVSKCANPDCNATFRYLHEGKLFTVPRTSGQLDSTPWPQRKICCVEYLWLCQSCSPRLDIQLRVEGQIVIVPKGRSQCGPSPSENAPFTMPRTGT